MAGLCSKGAEGTSAKRGDATWRGLQGMYPEWYIGSTLDQKPYGKHFQVSMQRGLLVVLHIYAVTAHISKASD